MKFKIKDKNGVELKEGDLLRQTTYYPPGQPNGHKYKILKWVKTQNKIGWNINTKTNWEKYETNTIKTFTSHRFRSKKVS